ncbi:MAG: hypothetical protein CVV64_08090 [Candidatus Wallbacteria bacterium HGW-Wallbacteria-1]|jgi:hypothetical protein|uniref:Polymerase nucleotidyl transferase domain-containing protein n=1 Tax=Candidatus Wallbacteria bacterium HGW-Wallbacteria-1 TaxID=2013854 RepID=A0A2N1PR65_9BACT|nr:MAG: hypothetical protein CVV64_08090 [Candidatus Wallbacteria bacterium HGW-Wallbacteria-1]
MKFGTPNLELMEKFNNDPSYKEFVLPISELDNIVDATFFVRKDGLLVFSEGYNHPKGKLIGNIIYHPDEKGKKIIFGTPYSSVIKIYLEDGTEEWVPFDQQLDKYFALDPALDAPRPPYAEYKLLFDLDEFTGFVPTRRSMSIIRSHSPKMDSAIIKLAKMLDMSPEDIGCSGSMSLGNFEDPHDLDLVIYGDTAKISDIIRRIYKITEDPERQVWEYGVKWAIRFYDDDHNMICPFFGYNHREDIPLKDFTLEVLENNIEVTGTIADDTHSPYMPTFLPLRDTGMKGEQPVLVIYNGGLRGEYRKDDRVSIKNASLCNIHRKDKNDTIRAILVTNLDQTSKIDK